MKKNEVVWLIIKLIGLYCVFSAITSAISFLGSFLTVLQEPKVLSTWFPIFLQSIAMIAFYGIVGNYLLKDGKFLFDILNQEEPPNKTQENLDEVSIK